MGGRKPDENVTFKLDPDVVMWARVRALLEGTSMNRVVARLLADYARVPQRWLDGLPPPWDEPEEAGEAREAGERPEG